ncbi:adhesion G-protein coupled receptor G6-like isoform X2 [Tribolium madens]|uniref:adhesion G-protein coupled receptor G6-like isoform X2 n=1 Tax=Tribolium madens TaxID=41895 RepID=UPI001CF73044|nr:adhesion G-protein coupled receptor G6-like isoform X2 [Tribolium madens]
MVRSSLFKIDETTPPAIFPIVETTTLPPSFGKTCLDHEEDYGRRWPETQAAAWATTNNMVCLHEDYLPVRRHCSEKAVWKEPDAKGCAQVTYTDTTHKLIDLLQKDSPEAINTLVELTEQDQKRFKVIDIYLISQILQKASSNNNIAKNPDNFTEVISNIMDFERETLNASQQLLNSTDNILYSFDKLLLQTRNTNITQPKLFIRTINVDNNVHRVMIKSNKYNNSFHYFEMSEFDNDEHLRNQDLEVAFLVRKNFPRDCYFISLFYNDYLFNQDENVTLGSWILSILIPETGNVDNPSIQIYFKEFNKHAHQSCNHWKYGNDENYIAKPGKWKFDSVAKKFKKGYYICEVNHTTHFGMLVSGTVPENFILDLITIFGSILSIIGIIVIILTAILFERGRNEISKKIVINVSICLLLLIILFIISDRVNNGKACITVGILLHYIVIAQFCWSLAVSYSSYRRYYIVFNYHVVHILKFCIFSWGVPLIIVTITAAMNYQTYDKSPDKESSQICYPKGIYLKFGVCLPMAVILTINLIIYIVILKNLTATKLNIRKHVTKKSYNKQKVLILLFFMMGMSWVFGFLVAFTDNIIFLYIFCTTATLHGFVIYLFYIVDSTDIKQQWKTMFDKIIPKKLTQKLSSKSQNTDIVSESVVG